MLRHIVNRLRVPYFIKPKKEAAPGLPLLRDQYPHYYVSTERIDWIDVYRVLRLFKINDPEIAHAIKKLLVCGLRGFKDSKKDVLEAIDSLKRWVEINDEDLKNVKR